MVRKRILIADRVRQGRGSFAYRSAREQLIAGDLIAFDSTLFQVLELPVGPVRGLR